MSLALFLEVVQRFPNRSYDVAPEGVTITEGATVLRLPFGSYVRGRKIVRDQDVYLLELDRPVTQQEIDEAETLSEATHAALHPQTGNAWGGSGGES